MLKTQLTHANVLSADSNHKRRIGSEVPFLVLAALASV